MSAIESGRYMRCVTVILVLPSEVRDEVVWDGKDEDLLFALSYFIILTCMCWRYFRALLKVRLTAGILLICTT